MEEARTPTSLLQEMQRHLVDGQLPCTAAHTIAHLLEIPPGQVGRAANEAEIPISQCQLGLFGYGPKAEGRSKLVRAAARVPPELAAALQERARDGRLRCATCWEIAAEMGVERLAVAEVAEALGLRIKGCQLGCF
ncbi:MAG: hypothetical protein H5T59_04960 [Anaerolineae bacterium]|nr:hypothetical protein [Anaerolineae bacterium]